MIPESLKSNERKLRKAIARCEYKGVPQRLADMRRIADEEIAANATVRREIAGWMLETIGWAQFMLATQRQIWSGESKALPNIGHYLDSPEPRPSVSVML